MKFEELLRRRSYPGMGTEPRVSYLYRVIGLFAAIVLLLGGIVSITTSLFPTTLLQALMASTFGIIILFTGIAASEVWAFTICRQYYSPARAPYSKYQLTLAMSGVSVATILIVLLAFLLPIL